MRKFCEHCYTEYTAQPRCPYCEARQQAGSFVLEDMEKSEPSKEALWEIPEEMLEERMEEIYPRDQVGVTGVFTRSKERWEYEMDEKYKREQEELFMDDF